MSARPTVGSYLERDRLAHRAARLELVVAALRARARDHAEMAGAAPAPLTHALSDFHRELAAVRARLSATERAARDA